MPEDSEVASTDRVLKPGQRVYDEAGRVIGVIQAITDIGVEVNTDSDVETLSLRQSPSVNLGEGYLVWRCSECGELGELNQIPDHCPSCGASKDTLYAYLED
jgi:Zn finger protein HypA/HybF involved in hydrogenase expression